MYLKYFKKDTDEEDDDDADYDDEIDLKPYKVR